MGMQAAVFVASSGAMVVQISFGHLPDILLTVLFQGCDE
jgi:hypothetical protein